MTEAQRIQKSYDIGRIKFMEFFQKSSADITEDLLAFEYSTWNEKIRHVIECGDIEKTTINDIPESIEIYFHDTIQINMYGFFMMVDDGTGCKIKIKDWE